MSPSCVTVEFGCVGCYVLDLDSYSEAGYCSGSGGDTDKRFTDVRVYECGWVDPFVIEFH